MDLLPFVPFFSVFLLATAGLASLTLAWTVWRRRRRALAGATGLLASAERLLFPFALIGCLALVLSLSLRMFFPRRGELFVRDAVVVYADPQRGVPSLSAQDQLQAGTVLVDFAVPGRPAEMERVRLEIERMTSERARLFEEPLDLHPILVREQQELIDTRRELQQRRAVYEVEQQRLEQQLRTDLLNKRIQLRETRLQFGGCAGLLARNAAEIVFLKLQLDSAADMRKAEARSELDYEEVVRNLRVLEAEKLRLEQEQQDRLQVQAELEAGIGELQTILAQQRAAVGRSLDAIEQGLQAASGRDADLQRRLALERPRLDRQRAAELRELELEIGGKRQRLLELEQQARELCPADGLVLFRHPAPASAPAGEPLVMFGAGDAVRARFKLPESEALQLHQHGDVELLLAAGQMLEPKLHGRLVDVAPMQHDAGMVLAELTCSTSAVQREQLAKGLALAARLSWAPSFLFDPLARLGLLLLLLPLLPRALAWLWRAAGAALGRPRGSAALASAAEQQAQ